MWAPIGKWVVWGECQVAPDFPLQTLVPAPLLGAVWEEAGRRRLPGRLLLSHILFWAEIPNGSRQMPGCCVS